MANDYLRQVNKQETNVQLVSLRAFAEEHGIPIITEDGIRFLEQIIILSGVRTVLEIGTAIGYSAIYLAKKCNVHVTTIERDHQMVEMASANIEAAQLTNRITLIEGDALEVALGDVPAVDLIFIDAAKAQSIHFFEKYKQTLSDKGIIVTDNLLFHGLVETDDPTRSKQLRSMIQKIRRFNEFVVEHDEFDTYIYDLGDGMSLSIRKR